jgi:hypothetical protein
LAFNPNAFAPKQLGNSARWSFQRPGIENFDVQMSKTVALFKESQSLDLRAEAFNISNHAQFFGPQAVEGVVNDADFGAIVGAASPRLPQIAVMVHF